jgi:predicted RNA-binding protein with RPS1 domain
MLVGVKGKVKEIKKNGVLVETEEEDIFIVNSNNGYIYDFNKLELKIGDPIRAAGVLIFDDSDRIEMFEPTYVTNETPRKFVPPLHK